MNCAQEGAYIRLLAYAWIDQQCSLPQEREALQQLARWRGREKGFHMVMACLDVHPVNPSRYTNLRLYEEWKNAEAVSRSHRKAAQTRWGNHAGSAPPGAPITQIPQDRSRGDWDSVAAITEKYFPPIP